MRAARGQPAFSARSRRPASKSPADIPPPTGSRQRAGVDLVGLHASMRDRLRLRRIGDHHARHERERTRDAAMALPVASTTASSVECSPPPGPLSAVRVMSTRPSLRSLPSSHTASPKVGDRCRSPFASRASVPFSWGSGGRHDAYGFALAAQPGQSQRRPATNASLRRIDAHQRAAGNFGRARALTGGRCLSGLVSRVRRVHVAKGGEWP